MADEEGDDNSSWRQRIARQDPRDISTQTRDVRPLPAYWEKPTPLFYFETWDLKALRKSDHNQIKAGLLAIHADFLDGKTGNLPEIECWRRAYDVFACPFHTAGFLTEYLVTEIIPAMVMDASASGRWAFGRKSREALIGEFRVKLGNEFYQEGYIRAVYLRLIEGRITYWRGRLILQGKFGTDDGSQSKLAAAELPDKGNPALLHGTNGEFKRAVTLDIASRFGGVSRRAIEKAAKKGALETEGDGPNRRIVVQSLLKYYPPENNAN